MTGPSTCRAIACTASKSPGLVIGKPASMMSTPSRASWVAISSFSWVFSEMPGDCSPSRSVVSKICTRSISSCFLSVSVCGLLLRLGLRLGGRHASLPPQGEEEKKGEAERLRPHQRASLPAAARGVKDTSTMHRMRVRRAILATATVALALPGAAGAHLGDDGYRDDSPDLPNPLIERLRTIPQPAPPLADDPAPPLPPMSGRFELVGHEPLYDRGMNSALAVHGHYVYVGNRSDGTHVHGGVLVVDVAKPSEPKVVNEIGPPDEALPGESSRELRVIPGKDLLVVLNHGCSEVIHRCASPSTATGVSEARSTVKFYDIAGANASAPKLVSTYVAARNQPQIPHEFFLWTDPREPSRVLMYWTAPSDAAKDGDPNLYVTDVSRAREGVFTELGSWTTVIDNPDRDNRLHSLTLSYDGRRAYLAFLGGGFMVADTSDFAERRAKPQIRLVTPVDKRVYWTDPGAHSAIKVPGQDYAMITDEVYGKLGGVLAAHGCPWGWVRYIDIADEAAPKLTSEYRLPVNDPST